MPSLFDLLQHTMVFVAAKGGPEPKVGQTSFAPPQVPASISDAAAATTPIWHFAAEGPAKFKELTCIARGMGMGRMTVCSEVSFGSIKVTLPDGSSTTLNLEQRFILDSYGLDGGRIAPGGGRVDTGLPPVPFEGLRGSALIHPTVDLYPIEMNLDKSVLHVFVFDFPSGIAGGAQPTARLHAFNENFMPLPTAKDAAPTSGQGLLTQVVVNPFRVVAFVSLVCCKERADFDPGGLLGGARMIPHVMVMANRPVQSLETSITITRPATMGMVGGDHSLHKNMNLGIESSLFADDNDAAMILLSGNTVPSPFWDDLFDGYESPAKTGVYKVVRPDKGARVVKDAIKKLNASPFSHDPLLPIGDEYKDHEIRRVRRQGAFDNIHSAPSFKIDDVSPKGVDKSILAKVYMAPFCEHDCLHTHWRWGEFTTEKHNRGWSSASGTQLSLVPGAPYTTVGSPMVPDNQQVDIAVNSASSYEYRVIVKSKDPIPAGTYSFINHHGSAYAVSVVGPLAGAKAFVKAAVADDLAEVSLSVVDFSSEKFYWHLRYALFAERLRGIDDLTKLAARERTQVVNRTKMLDE